MREEFQNLYNDFKECVACKNVEIQKRITEKSAGLASKEMLSLVVSENIIEDIVMILKLKKSGSLSRYSNMIIRNMCEQVIEYVYFMKNEELIEQYFGLNIRDEDEEVDLFEKLKQFGSGRFDKKRNIKQMACYIDEVKDGQEEISLYKIYSAKSEEVHNSYFNEFLDMVETVNDECEEDDDLDYIYLIFILSRFRETFDQM